jgi:hypothetical protein
LTTAPSCSPDASGHDPIAAASPIGSDRRGAADRRTPHRRPAQYEAYSLRKNQGLLELNRLIPALGGATAAGPLREALADLHAKLEANRRALGVQLKACAAVSEIIARAIQDGQSDGTYTALAWRRSRE